LCLATCVARPDELQAFLPLHFGQRRIDWSRKARVVELDRDVVAFGVTGLFLPAGAELHIACQDPEVGSAFRGTLDPDDLRLDVEVEGLDGSGEAVLGQPSSVLLERSIGFFLVIR
jgi:hypothetical protein